jgi:hypothetical protein
MQRPIKVQNWIEMFREVGLDDGAMKKWHQIFESRHPDDHQSFLEWLGFSASDIEKIRTEHR